MSTVYMHKTTFDYLKSHPDVVNFESQVMVSQYSPFSINGFDIHISDSLSPTVTEFPKGSWIFPKERFVTYEEKDEEWCRYFKIGHEARGFILGEIVGMGHSPRRKSTCFDLDRMTQVPIVKTELKGYPL